MVIEEKLKAFLQQPTHASPGKAVALQLCDWAKKHLNHTVPLLRALDAAGLEGIALCWGARGTAADIRSQGLRALAVESYVGWGTLLDSWRRTWRTWQRVLETKSRFLDSEDNLTKLLRPLLWDSVRVFFQSDVPQRYRKFHAMQRYWREHPVRAARLWTRVMWQGVVAYRAFPPGPRPVLFWQPGWPYQLPSPYRQLNVPIDQVYALSQEHVRQLCDHDGFDANKIVIAGLPWMERLERFKREHARSDSRRAIGIPAESDFCVLCDPGYFIRGYMAASEQAQLLETLLCLARDHPEMQLLVKPHPSHRPGQLEATVARFRMRNLTVVSQSELPYHALNAVDVLVTKFSTLALEGMVLGVPAIGLILDGEKRFACYEDAVHYVWDAAALQDQLQRLLDSRDYRAAWTEDLARKSKAFLARHTFEGDCSASDRIARHLRTHLS